MLFLDGTFSLSPIGAAAPLDAQFVFVTATLPETVTSQLQAEFPGLRLVVGPGLHRAPATLTEVLVDCSAPTVGAAARGGGANRGSSAANARGRAGSAQGGGVGV